MSLQFCFLLNVLLVSRLILIFQEKPVSGKQIIVMILAQFMGLLVYKMDYAWVVLATILILLDISFYFLEKRTRNIDRLRLLSLLINVIILNIFFSPWINLNFNPGLSGKITLVGRYSLLFTNMKGIDWLKLNTLLLGLLLTTNEANILIRYLFKCFQLVTKHEASSIKGPIVIPEEREYNAGRIIGILERALIYFLVLKSQYAAMGFILAAKSFTRFKELEKREFAEYVLIGTLLSTLFAVAIASLIRILLA